MSIEWVLGHSVILENDHANQLAREAAALKKSVQTSIASLIKRVSQHYSIAKYTKTDWGKYSILAPAPKKSFLDGASNRLAHTIAQIRTGHWLCVPYLKRTRKNWDDELSDRYWGGGQWRLSYTYVSLRYMQPTLVHPTNEIWDWPDEQGKIPKWPMSIG
jgi:hypothetical protein